MKQGETLSNSGSTQNLYLGTVSVVPLLFIAFVTGEGLWRKMRFKGRTKLWKVERHWKLVVGALLLGSLPVSEVIALGSLARNSYSEWRTDFIIVSLTLVLVTVAWRLGWTIWDGLEPDLQTELNRTWPKRFFYGVGVITAAGCLAGAVWAVH